MRLDREFERYYYNKKKVSGDYERTRDRDQKHNVGEESEINVSGNDKTMKKLQKTHRESKSSNQINAK